MSRVAIFSIDPAQLAELQASLSPKQVKQAAYQAVKRTTAAAKRLVQEEVERAVAIDTKYARRRIIASMNRGDIPVGTVSISRRGVPLIGYLDKVSKKGGAVIGIWRDRAALAIRHGFKARMASAAQQEQGASHVGIFLRARPGGWRVTDGRMPVKTGRYRGWAARLAVKEAYGPSIAKVVEVPKVQAKVESRITDILAKNVQSQLDRFLSRRKSK
jgi:hypothetical protein